MKSTFVDKQFCQIIAYSKVYIKIILYSHLFSEGVKVNGANFITYDISATNGVVHAIDSVLQPPSVKRIMQRYETKH